MAVDNATEDDGLEPQAAFALVGHETWFAILRALWDAGDETLTFSELRAAVGNPDAGNFNYHLGELLGPFVAKHDDDSPTYELTVAGGHVMGAIESGGYRRTERVGPVRIEGSCPECAGSLEAVYEDDLGCVQCTDCGLRVFNSPIPAGAVAGYEAAELPTLLDRWVRATLRSVTARICPVCSGRLDGHLVDEDSRQPAEQLGANFTCRQCSRTVDGAVTAWFVEHPAVVQFTMDHGVDPRDRPLWSDAWRESVTAERHTTDPLRVAVRFALGDETLELLVGESVEVVEWQRRSGE